MTGETRRDAMVLAMVARADRVRVESAANLKPSGRRQLGQYFTPPDVAAAVVQGSRLPLSGTFRVLDAGAGTGSLTVALVARLLTQCPDLDIDVTAVEYDLALTPALEQNLKDCASTAAALGVRLRYNVESADFISWAERNLAATDCLASRVSNEPAAFDLVIMNPPYKKIGPTSAAWRTLNRMGVDVPNIYAAFIALGVLLLKRGGQLAAITPRSFANGVYFRNFRQWMLSRIGIDRLTAFHERGSLFSDDDVLQENVILAAVRDLRSVRTTVVNVRHMDGLTSERTVPYEDIVVPSDSELFIRLPTEESDKSHSSRVLDLPTVSEDLGLKVSTGRVVDFRCTEFLRDDPDANAVPLIYPAHLVGGRVRWPLPNFRKSNAIANDPATRRLFLPVGHYVLVKRFSVKEDNRRIVASHFCPDDVAANFVGFENHLNVIHSDSKGLDPLIAQGLCVWLNSTVLDKYYRQISGHTQVNAADIRSLRFPTATQLTELGRNAGAEGADQQLFDELVRKYVLNV